MGLKRNLQEKENKFASEEFSTYLCPTKIENMSDELQPTPEVQAPVLPAPPAKQTFTITEDAANQLFTLLVKLPWEQANPIIKLVQESLTSNK